MAYNNKKVGAIFGCHITVLASGGKSYSAPRMWVHTSTHASAQEYVNGTNLFIVSLQRKYKNIF